MTARARGIAARRGGWQHDDVDYVLAQVNIARMREPLDSPLLADFAAALEPVNAAADAAPGFIWRLQGDGGNATSVQAFEWDQAGSAGVLVNMSVWESVEALAAYVYSDAHREVLRRRRQWFTRWRRRTSRCGGYRAGTSRPPKKLRNGSCTCGTSVLGLTSSPSRSMSRRRMSPNPGRSAARRNGRARPYSRRPCRLAGR
jgi:hypothetical protein